MAKRWIQSIKMKKGAFRKKADKARMSTSKYAKEVLKKDSKASEKTKRQARLAQTFSKLRKKKK